MVLCIIATGIGIGTDDGVLVTGDDVISRSSAEGRVVIPLGVVLERIAPTGRVEFPLRVVSERRVAAGCVEEPYGVVSERIVTEGRVGDPRHRWISGSISQECIPVSMIVPMMLIRIPGVCRDIIRIGLFRSLGPVRFCRDLCRFLEIRALKTIHPVGIAAVKGIRRRRELHPGAVYLTLGNPVPVDIGRDLEPQVRRCRKQVVRKRRDAAQVDAEHPVRDHNTVDATMCLHPVHVAARGRSPELELHVIGSTGLGLTVRGREAPLIGDDTRPGAMDQR